MRDARGPRGKEEKRGPRARGVGSWRDRALWGGNKQGPHRCGLRGPRAAVGDAVASQEEIGGMDGGSCEGPQTRPPSPPSARPHTPPQLTSNVGHGEAPSGGAAVCVQQKQELVVARGDWCWQMVATPISQQGGLLTGPIKDRQMIEVTGPGQAVGTL